MKGLEALEKLVKLNCLGDPIRGFLGEIITIEKELKAFEIIKATGILAVFETIGNERTLETMFDKVKLTKENYDLLKEVLKDD